jgi:hypothetical protein
MSGYHTTTPIPEWQFIPKPFDRATVLRKVEDVLRRPGEEVRLLTE